MKKVSFPLLLLLIYTGLTAQKIDVYQRPVQAEPDRDFDVLHYCIRLDIDMEGKKLSLEIELPLDDSGAEGKMIVIKTTGAVIRSGPDGMAIRFNKDLDIKLQPIAESRIGE